MVSYSAAGRATSHGVAKRLRQSGSGGPPSRTQVMQMVVCSQCSDRFAITHETAGADPELAKLQAVWLQDQFVWDHIQETKHRSSVALPSAEEIEETRSHVAGPRG